MPVIEADAGIVTQINVFTTEPDRQQDLVDALTETVNAAKEMPGWISASIHRSFDGRQVANYVQYASREAARDVTERLLAMGLIQRNTAIGRVQPGEHEVVHTASIP